MSRNKLEEKKYNTIYFHGKDIRSKKFQKNINRRHTLARTVSFNVIIILILLFIVWILANLAL
jgi:uncharacterized membrane protein